MRILFTLQYLGTRYAGWQTQTNAVGVQQVVEAALSKMFGAPVRVEGAGRTDAGVHAQGQVANFTLDANIPTLGLLRGLNSLLPPDIALLDVAEAPPEFDARFSARGKLYRYHIWNHLVRSPLHARVSWHCRGTIDLEAALKEGSRRFEPGVLAEANRNILYVDEVNLLDDHIVDVLLDAGRRRFPAALFARADVSVSFPWYPRTPRPAFVLTLPARPHGVGESTDVQIEIVDGRGRATRLRDALISWK